MIELVGRMLVGLAIFAAAGFAGVLLARRACESIVAFDDGPATAEPPSTYLIAACALLGSIVVLRGAPLDTIVLSAVIWTALVACWYCDVARGIVPDMFTLVPLIAVLAYGIASHRYDVIIAAIVPFVPFAAAAFLSKGMGMGWGDVKLAALGGAVLGMQNAVLAFGIACIAAVICSRGVRGSRTRRPIAFAPYLAASIGIGIAYQALPIWHR